VSADHRPDPALLAEYAEGLLAGTPEGDEVAARLAADPAWSAAYAELTGALAAVRAGLAALGPVGPVPAEVADRLDAALATAGGPGEFAVRPRRGRRRVVAPVLAAAAASVAVLLGFSVVAALRTDPSAPTVASVPGTVLPDHLGETLITSTGLDYGTVAAQDALRSPAPPVGLSAAGTDSSPPPAPPPASPVPLALARLTSPAALEACLEAVRALVGATSPAPRSADFARFGGVPALVIVLTAEPAGRPQVLAVGPDCGAGGVDLISRTGGTP
jgi:hypothetical protein